MSIFDIEDKKIISSTNLIEDGWRYEGFSKYSYRHNDYDWSKTVKLNLGDGYYCYCTILFNSETKKIYSSDTYNTSIISNMNDMNRFIDKQLKYRIEKFRDDYYE